ncbi:MAG: amylo-alpha-1,6-glucosidase [Paludibacter sp.]|nr:amylo-alpha-1,6-glucosidase [Paludibacter sp.]
MPYIFFDKNLMTNLERSLSKEIIRTNRAGAYSSSSITECNTRKYHGLLVTPVPELDDANHVILSSLDETIVQHGAEFNLGLHQYEGNNFSPNGHKYIRQFDCEVVSRTLYRVGGVIMSRELLLVGFEPRLLLKYTLLDAHSPTIIRFRPFLAFRRVDELTHVNSLADNSFEKTENGISVKMYDGYPRLYMQFSKKNTYTHSPDWYNNIKYYKEEQRGYEYLEDLYVSGAFEMSVKKGETIIFSAGFSKIDTSKLKILWDYEYSKRNTRPDMFNCLKNSAQQFYLREGNKVYLLAGYPWYKPRARDEFIALAPCTLAVGRNDYFEDIMNTAIDEIKNFLSGKKHNFKIEGLDAPDALLWFINLVQQYGNYTSPEEAARKYGKFVLEIVDFIRRQKHKYLLLHSKGLLYVDGRTTPATWMNAVENGRPITPRTGYIVEINALWYNALKYAAVVSNFLNEKHTADLLENQAERMREAFVETFWNGIYLYDFVDGEVRNREVRPNMIYAVGLPFSPLEKTQQKAVLDIVTRELLTPKGLRSLSPKSGMYRPNYVGGHFERDRNYHNGPVWTFTFSAFVKAYFKIYKESGLAFVRRMLVGFEAEMPELCIGTLNELYDGNPPFKGHGGMSFAASVGAVLEVMEMVRKMEEKIEEKIENNLNS